MSYPNDPETPSINPLGMWVRCGEARDAALSNKRNYPLVVLSHGHGGDRFDLIVWLAEVLAANGYIVASMDHMQYLE